MSLNIQNSTFKLRHISKSQNELPRTYVNPDFFDKTQLIQILSRQNLWIKSIRIKLRFRIWDKWTWTGLYSGKKPWNWRIFPSNCKVQKENMPRPIVI